MKYINIIALHIIILLYCGEISGKNYFDSTFYYYEIETSNINETKNNLIKEVQKKSLNSIINIILDPDSHLKFMNLFKSRNNINELVKNIIIENEIITDEKYIANIKVNFDIKKIISLLRDNKINYSDINSEPFLIVSSYSSNFIRIGLDKRNLFSLSFQENSKKRNDLINYYFPNLDTNDKYIMPYHKIIEKNDNAYNSILNKYNLNHLIYINFKISNDKKNTNIDIYQFTKNNLFKKIDHIIFKNQKTIYSEMYFNELANFLIIYLSEWWKNEHKVNNSLFNKIKCKVLSKDFEDLTIIKSNISNLYQVKNIKTKKIKLNENIIEISYYGDLNIFIKKLLSFDILYSDNNECVISKI